MLEPYCLRPKFSVTRGPDVLASSSSSSGSTVSSIFTLRNGGDVWHGMEEFGNLKLHG